MLVTTRHWWAIANGDNRIVVQQKRRTTELTQDMMDELGAMQKLCFPEYDLHIKATDGRVNCEMVKIAADTS